MSEKEFDVIVIGSGPGGYVAAIRGAQLGLRVVVVEKETVFGGTCLNVGCIPSKALLESSEHYDFCLKEAQTHGVLLDNVKFDLSKMMMRKEKIVKDLTQGIGFLFKKNKVASMMGVGRIIQKRGGPPSDENPQNLAIVEVVSANGNKSLIYGKNILCATGSVPIDLPFVKIDEKKVVSSTGALSLMEVPKRLVVIGGGVIGLELGSVWNRLGSQVTVVEFLDHIGGSMDAQTMQVLQKSLEKNGMNFLTGTKVISVDVGSDSAIKIKSEKKEDIFADIVLVATGRKPYSVGLGLEQIGVKKDARGFVLVDKHFQTNVDGIYAIGDLIPGPMLAHKAEEEGVAFMEIIAGQAGHVNYETLPSVIYTSPEVASVGPSEETLKAHQIPYVSGKFPFMANGRAKALGMTEGWVKILADPKSDRIIAGHIVGPRASELIGEIIISMEFGGSSEDLARSFHAHPTLNEVIREAALNVEKRARQM